MKKLPLLFIAFLFYANASIASLGSLKAERALKNGHVDNYPITILYNTYKTCCDGSLITVSVLAVTYDSEGRIISAQYYNTGNVCLSGCV